MDLRPALRQFRLRQRQRTLGEVDSALISLQCSEVPPRRRVQDGIDAFQASHRTHIGPLRALESTLKMENVSKAVEDVDHRQGLPSPPCGRQRLSGDGLRQFEIPT